MKISRISMGLGILMLGVLTGCGEAVKANMEEMPQVAETTGQIEAWGEVKGEVIKEIYIDFPAIVEEISVKEGQLVTKGEKLMTFNASPYKQSILIKEKEAALEKISSEGALTDYMGQSKNINALKEELNLLEKSINDPQEPELLSIESGLTEAKGQLRELLADYKLQKDLLEVGGTSQKVLTDLEIQKVNLENQVATLEAKKNNWRKQKLVQIEKLKAQIATTQDALTNTLKGNGTIKETQGLKDEVSALQIEMMKDKLEKSYLKDQTIICDLEEAIVSKVNVTLGSRLGEESGCVLCLIDRSSLKITAHVPEEFIKSVALGNKVEIVPYTDKTVTLSGIVTAISNEVVKENGETVINIEVTPDEASEYLQAGYGVDVFIFE